jgi:hypothetical protein
VHYLCVVFAGISCTFLTTSKTNSMKWEPVKHASSLVSKYHLAEGADIQLVLKHNIDQESLRIGNDGKQRLFFIVKTGFWNNKLLFKNEYGLEAGRLSFDRGYHAGTVEMEGHKYHYGIDTASHQLVIYKQYMTAPVIACDLPGGNIEQDFTCLVWGLCWQLISGATVPVMEYVH